MNRHSQRANPQVTDGRCQRSELSVRAEESGRSTVVVYLLTV